MNKDLTLTISTAVLLLLSLSGDSTASAQATFPQRVEKDGVAIQFSVESLSGGNQPDSRGKDLLEGSDAMITFTLTEPGTGKPLTGLRPNAWVSVRKTVGLFKVMVRVPSRAVNFADLPFTGVKVEP